LVTGRNRRLTDSLSLQEPFAMITVTPKKGDVEVYRLFRKTYEGGFSKDMGSKLEYDPDRFYMNFDGGRQWALSQYYVFGKLCVTTSYFRPSATVKK
jgi:hypothetical protein